MSDRMKIRAVVQRLRRELGEQRDVNLDELIAYIDSMPEEHSEDLEEVADKYAQQHSELLGFDCDCEPIQTGPELKKAVKFGAEWQKQQMMKDAVEGEVRKGYVGNQIVVHSKENNAKYVAFDASYADAFCVGDKVKIIIVKENML